MEISIDLATNLIFDLFSSISKDPSRTIRIKPIVPITGKIGVRSGIEILKKRVPNFTTQPKLNNKIMDGILVFEEVMSKK